MLIEISFIPALLVILLVAAVGRLISLKTNQPEILGELVLGIIIGTFITFTPAAKGPVSELAEIGVLILLFSVGLDLELDRFKEMSIPASGAAFGGVVLPFVLGYFGGIFYGIPKEIALFVGASLVATSVGISASILHDSGKLNTRLGTLILDSAVIDDVIGILVLTVLLGFATTGHLPLADLFFLVAFSVLFFGLSLTLGISIFREISERIPFRRENLLLGGLVILLSFALIAERIGLAGIIGAFVAGLVLGQTQFSESITGPVSMIGKGFFIPIFFVTMGMEFQVGSFKSVGFFALVLVVLSVVGKIVGSGLGAKSFGFSGRESLATGVGMLPRAEVALIIANFGLRNNVIPSGIFSAIVVMVVVTTLITPPLLWRVLDWV